MSPESLTMITKDRLDFYFEALAKTFRRLNGRKASAELVVVGSAAVLANYHFRDMTMDVDTLIRATSSLTDAIHQVADKYNLPGDWVNDEFIKSDSYSPKSEEVSVFYKTFSYVLTVRTVSAEYLVAMKLQSGRKYKKDLSDIVGILMEQKEKKSPLTLEQIKKAAIFLYENWEAIPEDSRSLIESLTQKENYEEIYQETRKEEINVRQKIIDFEKKYPLVLNKDNLEKIIFDAQSKLKKK